MFDVTLDEALFNYTVPILKKLVSLVADKPPTRKAEIIGVLLKKLTDRDYMQGIWSKLDSHQKAAVAETLFSPDLEYKAAQFEAKYGQLPNFGPMTERGKEKCEYLRLFIHRRKIPPDLAEVLEGFVSAPEEDHIVGLDAAPEVHTIPAEAYYPVRENIPVTTSYTEKAGLHDVFAVMRLIDEKRISASDKTKKVGTAGRKAITEVLLAGDFYPHVEPANKYDQVAGSIKAFAWPLLLQAARLVELAGTRLKLTTAGVKALSQPPEEAIRTIWSRWNKTTIIDEMSRIDTIRGQSGKGKRSLTSPGGRRAVIVDALRECPFGRWIAFEELSRYMRANRHTFDVTRDTWTLYIAEKQYGSLGYAGFADWDVLEERYIRVFLFEYLATLGLIDVAYIHPADAQRDFRRLWGVDDLVFLSRYDGLLTFRITGLGAWCLGMVGRYERQQVEKAPILRVLTNHDVVAVKPLPPGDVFFLDAIAERTGDYVWALSQNKMLEAVERRYSVSEIEEFLEAKSKDQLPETLKFFLQELSERSSCFTEVGRAVLIEVKNSDVGFLVAHDSRLKSLCLPAGDHHLVVREGQLDAFLKALRTLGYSLRRGA